MKQLERLEKQLETQLRLAEQLQQVISDIQFHIETYKTSHFVVLNQTETFDEHMSDVTYDKGYFDYSEALEFSKEHNGRIFDLNGNETKAA